MKKKTEACLGIVGRFTRCRAAELFTADRRPSAPRRRPSNPAPASPPSAGSLSRMLERGTRSIAMIFRAIVFTFVPTALELAGAWLVLAGGSGAVTRQLGLLVSPRLPSALVPSCCAPRPPLPHPPLSARRSRVRHPGARLPPPRLRPRACHVCRLRRVDRRTDQAGGRREEGGQGRGQRDHGRVQGGS